MKLVAYSVVPPDPVPYLHLGYISALPFENTAPTLMMAAIFLFVAVNAGKQRPLLRWIFTILTCLAIVTVPILWHQGVLARDRIMMKARISSTRSSARQVMVELDMINKELGEVPSDLSTLGDQYGFTIKDAWDRPFRLVKEGSGKQIRCEIRSDGPDKTPGTKDDLRWPYTPPKKRSNNNGVPSIP